MTRIGPTLASWNSSSYSYSYDSASRAIGAGRYGGFASTFATIRWDADGRVAAIDIGAAGWGGAYQLFSEHRYGALIRERLVPDLGSPQIERIVPGPLGEIAHVRSGGKKLEILYQHNDGVGRRMVTDESSDAVQLLDYTPFGIAQTDTGDAGGFEYTRQQFNYGTVLGELGVTLLGPRFYHPATGRFLQRDPVMIDEGASPSNPYAFAFDDPINYVDPTGLSPRRGIRRSGTCVLPGARPPRYAEFLRVMAALPAIENFTAYHWRKLGEQFSTEEVGAFLLYQNTLHRSFHEDMRRQRMWDRRAARQISQWPGGSVETGGQYAHRLRVEKAKAGPPKFDGAGAFTGIVIYGIRRGLGDDHETAVNAAVVGAAGTNILLGLRGLKGRFSVQRPGKATIADTPDGVLIFQRWNRTGEYQ